MTWFCGIITGVIFLFFLVMGIVPPWLFLPIVILGDVWLLRMARRHLLQMVVLGILVLAQTSVAVGWWATMTTSSAWLGWGIRDLAVSHVVLDPFLEQTLMTCFWCLAGLGMLLQAGLIVWDRSRAKLSEESRPRLARIGPFVLEGIILFLVLVNWTYTYRMSPGPVFVPDCISPDKSCEFRVARLNGIHGLAIWRNPGSLWWHPAGQIRDDLSSPGRFVWGNDSGTVDLWLRNQGVQNMELTAVYRRVGLDFLPCTPASSHRPASSSTTCPTHDSPAQ